MSDARIMAALDALACTCAQSVEIQWVRSCCLVKFCCGNHALLGTRTRAEGRTLVEALEAAVETRKKSLDPASGKEKA